MKRVVLCLIAVFLLLSVSLESLYAAGGTEKILKVGILADYSGAGAGWTIPIARGVELVAEDINKKGGLDIGGQKYIIKLVTEDNRYTPEGAASGANRLLEQNVDLLLACVVSHTTLAALEILEPAKKLTFNTADADATIIGKKFSVRTYMAPFITTPGMFNYLIREHPEIKKVAQIGNNTESGWFSCEKTTAYVNKKSELEMVSTEVYEPGTTDFYPVLGRILKAKPDVIVGSSAPPDEWALIVKQSRELGYDGYFMVPCEPDDEVVWKVAGKEAHLKSFYVGYAIRGENATPEAKAWYKKYVEKYGEYEPLQMLTAPGVYHIFMAMQDIGSIDSAKVIAALESGKQYKTPVLGEPGAFGGKATFGRNAQYYAPQWILETTKEGSLPVAPIPLEELLHGWD